MARSNLHWLNKDSFRSGGALFVHGYDSIDLAACFYSDGPNKDGQNFNFQLYGSLLPVPIHHWAPENTEHQFPLIAESSFPLLAQMAKADSLLLNKAGWIKYFGKLAKRYGTVWPRLRKELQDPIDTFKFGVRLAKIAGRRLGVDSQEFIACLILVGISSQQFGTFPKCELCFRYANLDSRFCKEHSQSKWYVEGRTQSQQSMDARAGRLTKKLVERNSLIPTYWDLHQTEHAVLAGLLWGHSTNDDLKKIICGSIDVAPTVKHLLPLDYQQLNSTQLSDLLRKVLDANQWSDYCWPISIAAAEIWFSAERRAKPGAPPKGPSKLTKIRLHLASEMLSQKLAKKEMAQRLKISESNLSKLLGRYRDLL
jgi:hypothetical protein